MRGSQPYYLRFATDELEKIEDQQIEMEALSQMNDHIEDIENGVQRFSLTTPRSWKTRPLKIIQKITIFITKLKHYSASYRFKSMQRHIFNLIYDKASSFSYFLNNHMFYQSPKFLQRIKYNAVRENPLWWRFLSYIRKESTILLPADRFLFVWDFILMTVTIINIFYVPLQLAFQLDESDIGTVFILFSTIPSCVFVIDLVLCFFKAYYDKGILRTKKSEIFWHYVQGDFGLDCVVILPFILSFFGYTYANYLMLIRMTRVRRTMTNIEEISNFKEKTAVIYQLFCLVYSLLLMSHFCACLFHYMAILEIDHGYTHTWLHAQNIADEDNYVKYFNSLYWVTITSMTVGYGDVVPVTLPEKIVVTIISFFVTGVFGYALGMIQSIFYKMAEQQNLNNSKLRLVSTHIKARGLNPQLQFRVRKYIEYYLQFKQEEELDLDELMGQLNPKLKKEVQIAMYYRYLKSSQLFGSNFSDEILKKLCYCIHERTFAPEEILMKKDEVPDKFYIILTGRIKSVALNEAIKRYRSGQLVGEKEFFLQDFLVYDMVASTFVQVAYLNYQDFKTILQKEKSTYEKYRYLVDNTYYGDSSQQIICEGCQSHHYFKHCPLLFFRKNKQKVIRDFNQSHEQSRKALVRNKKNKFKLTRVRDSAFDQIKKNKVETGVQINQRFLGLIGYKQFQNDEEEMQIQQSYQDLGAVSTQRLQRRPTFQIEGGDTLVDRVQQHTKTECDIDKVAEYLEYYPHYNISKITKLINKQSLYARILDRIRNHKNKFAAFIAQKLVYRIL